MHSCGVPLNLTWAYLADVSQQFDPSSDDTFLDFSVFHPVDTAHRELASMGTHSALSLEASVRISRTARTNIQRLSQLLEAHTIMGARSIFFQPHIPERIIRRRMGPSVLFVPLSLMWKIHPHPSDNIQDVEDELNLYIPNHRVFKRDSNYVHSMIL